MRSVEPEFPARAFSFVKMPSGFPAREEHGPPRPQEGLRERSVSPFRVLLRKPSVCSPERVSQLSLYGATSGRFLLGLLRLRWKLKDSGLLS